MRYLDSIYGEIDVEEPVLSDLMQTQAMQRLRGVLQHGITALIGITQPVTRFDHSMGVMLLVRQLHARHPERNVMESKDERNAMESKDERNAMESKHARSSLEEQIAALLHDVSHTAFSHVIDYVVDGHDRQSYHEAWQK